MIGLKQRDDLARQHWEAISTRLDGLKGLWNLSYFDNLIQDTLGKDYDLKRIILAPPKEIVEINELYLKKLPTEPSARKVFLRRFNCFHTNYRNLVSIPKSNPFKIGEAIYSSSILIQNLGLRVCPYCNRNHIGYIKGAKKSIHQLDHYYPKSRFPILALSFYNLIPCCAACNRMKLDVVPTFPNPYDATIGHQSALKFRIRPSGANFITKDSDLDLKLSVVDPSKQTEMDALKTTFHLEDAYQDHKRDAREALLRHHVYSDDRLKEIARMLFGEKFSSQDLERVRSMTFGAPLDEEDIVHRSLGKLVFDVLEGAGLGSGSGSGSKKRRK